VATGRELVTSGGLQAQVPAVAATRDGKAAVWAVTSSAAEILILDPLTGDKIKTMPVQDRSIACQAFSPDGSIGLVGDRGGSVRIWNIDANERIGGDLPAHKNISELAITNDQKYLVTGGDDGEIKIWDGKTRKLLHAVPAHTERVVSISLSPDGKRFLSCGVDKVAKLWDTASGKELRSWKNIAANQILFAPDGKNAVTANHNTTLYLLDCAVQ
jgi:WD40 repeat protein